MRQQNSRVRLPPLRQYRIHLRRCPRHHSDLQSPLPHRRKPVLPRWYRTFSYRNSKADSTTNTWVPTTCSDLASLTSARINRLEHRPQNRSALTLFGAEQDHFKSTLTKATTSITILATVRNNTSP